MIYWYEAIDPIFEEILQTNHKCFDFYISGFQYPPYAKYNIGHTVEWLNIGVQFRRYIINFMRSTTVASSFINVIEIIDSRISDFKVYYYLIYANLQTLKVPN